MANLSRDREIERDQREEMQVSELPIMPHVETDYENTSRNFPKGHKNPCRKGPISKVMPSRKNEKLPHLEIPDSIFLYSRKMAQQGNSR